MGKRKYVAKLDRHLIAEQPGRTVLMIGLVVSFLIGYTIRSFLSPARVSVQIEKAASHIHKDVRVHFDSAEFSLSDGILPQMAIIISKVRMESNQACWGAPLLEVDELRLPISFFSLIRGQGAIRDIQANIVNLYLRQDIKKCEEPARPSDSKGPAFAPKVSSQVVTLSPSQDSRKYQNDVRNISLQKLTVISSQFPQYQPELLGFVVTVKSYDPLVIELTAKSHLVRDEAVGDYLSHANLYVQYKESPERTVQTHFFGNWREGHYSLIANYNLEENSLALESDLKHIPLSQILQILHKYGLVSNELNGRQVWISSRARAVAPIEKIKSSPVEVRDLRLEGDLGDMHVEQIKIKSVEPFIYSPIHVQIDRLDVEKLLNLINRPKKTNILASLGQFSGHADINSDRDIKISGEHRGLEFVFSNKGQRELQVIDSMVGNVSLKNNDWKFDIRRIEPRAGVFLGQLSMSADRDFHDVDIRADVSEVSLDPTVQKLMTNGGSVGNMTIEADIKLKQGQLSYLKGLVRADAMNIESMIFGKSRAVLDWRDQEMILKTQMSSLEIASESVAAGLFKTVSFPSWWSEDRMKLSALDGEFHLKAGQNMLWRKFQAQVGKAGKMSMEGGWDSSGLLHGQILNREGKEIKKWKISGTREEPVFVSE